MKRDFHIHSTFSDGADTPREVVGEAVAKGISAVGFSDHSFVSFDTGGCLPPDCSGYIAEIARLKAEYRGRIDIYCGIEQDVCSGAVGDGFDYSIGSVHYIDTGDGYLPVDLSAGNLISAAKKYFGGDMLALTEKYFESAAKVISVTKADIIGHFDLISKFNEGDALFDSGSKRYISAWTDAADALIAENKPFEINTGAVSRGYRSECYPSYKIAEYIKSRGGRFILSSDSHKKEALCFGFEELERRFHNSIVSLTF